MNTIEDTRILDILTPSQREALTSAAKNKIVDSGRRSGKTFYLAAQLIHTCLNNPNSKCLFLSFCSAATKRVSLPTVQTVLERAEVPYRLDMRKNTFIFTNGSVIGLNGLRSCEVRGEKYDQIAIDEPQLEKDFSALVSGVSFGSERIVIAGSYLPVLMLPDGLTRGAAFFDFGPSYLDTYVLTAEELKARLGEDPSTDTAT